MTEIVSAAEETAALRAEPSGSPPEQPRPLGTPDSAPATCQYCFADGRRCRMPVWKPDGELCLMHRRQWYQVAGADEIGKQLTTPSGAFKTANDINHALGNLFSLLAKNKIAARDAAVLAYIGQLLLQTLSPMNQEIQTAFGWKALEATIKDALSAEEAFEAPNPLE